MAQGSFFIIFGRYNELIVESANNTFTNCNQGYRGGVYYLNSLSTYYNESFSTFESKIYYKYDTYRFLCSLWRKYILFLMFNCDFNKANIRK